MHCPFCRNTDTRVLDSRVADEGGSIRHAIGVAGGGQQRGLVIGTGQARPEA